MYCHKCGKEISDDSAFCKYCGATLKESDKKKSSGLIKGITAGLVILAGLGAFIGYQYWASQYMDKSTNSNFIWRNVDGRKFNKDVRAGSRELEEELNTTMADPYYGISADAKKMKIAAENRKSALAEAEAIRKEHERQRRAYLNAGLSDIDDPTPRKSTFPKEWLPKK